MAYSRMKGRCWLFTFLIPLFLCICLYFTEAARELLMHQPHLEAILHYRPHFHSTAMSSVHAYNHDGLLVVNPHARHPILDLMKRAEKEWAAKQKKASHTLEEAIAEYQKRYKRLPPKGFDEWWQYVQEQNVQLPDEYDMIWTDIEPFWGISPTDLLSIQTNRENTPDSYTLGKLQNGTIGIVHTTFSDTDASQWDRLMRGSAEIVALLKPVEHLLPPFRAIFSPWDNPNLVTDYHVKKHILDAAAADTYVNISELPPVSRLGFASACHPDSPARKSGQPIDHSIGPIPHLGPKTFIHNHRATMDPCMHPSHFYNHGQFLPYPAGTPAAQHILSALFSFCSTTVHHNIQPPTFISWVEDLNPRENDPPWENKTDERLLWRGSNTGMDFNEGTPWRHSQRPRLVNYANDLSETTKILMKSAKDETFDNYVGHDVEIKKTLINPAIFDIAFSGNPIACPPEYCKYLEQQFDWRRRQDENSVEVGRHKYIMDIDGNAWSSRFKRLITTNSLVFKATIYPEWWLDRIQPWVHYVPIQVDLSDLYDTLIFFRGGLYGEGSHDELGRKIALAGREWSLNYWRREDMTAYFFRLLLEYARVMSEDRQAMTYKP